MKLLVLAILGLTLSSALSRGSSILVSSSTKFALQAEYFGDPLPGLSAADSKKFEQGFRLFTRQWLPAQGLGPKFNAMSCATCHRQPLPGGSGTTDQDSLGLHSPSSLDEFGTTTHRRMYLHNGEIAQVPIEISIKRRTPSLFGLGLLEAISDDDIKSNLRQAQKNKLSAKLHNVDSKIFRFGVLCDEFSLKRFVARALAIELGVESALSQQIRTENCKVCETMQSEVSEDDLDLLTHYIRTLAPPKKMSGQVIVRGEALFNKLKCTACHRSSYQIINPASGQPALIYPYTDLLLHKVYRAKGSSDDDSMRKELYVRTPALWGVWAVGPPYLHDGRARSLDQAIRFHEKSIAGANSAYSVLSRSDQEELIRFLRSL